MSDALLTSEMLMALEEMPPHTLYRSQVDELVSYPAPITVYRCDCVPRGAYVVVCDRLAEQYGMVPRYWTQRDDFLLDMGYRGVRAKMVWYQVMGAANPCDDPDAAQRAPAESLAAIREGLAS